MHDDFVSEVEIVLRDKCVVIKLSYYSRSVQITGLKLNVRWDYNSVLIRYKNRLNINIIDYHAKRNQLKERKLLSIISFFLWNLSVTS